MGWASGTEVACDIIDGTREIVPNDGTRKRLYKVIIEALEGHDWDTQDEAMGIDPVFDEAMKELHPDWEQEA